MNPLAEDSTFWSRVRTMVRYYRSAALHGFDFAEVLATLKGWKER